ncbi:venom allergen 5.01-like [Oratosquilla oratoria]|uniref:venom allergen 5.01-like n=1 Tax=Oratosquilla oratoria TaxID=337810 RepID=UPI003F772525
MSVKAIQVVLVMVMTMLAVDGCEYRSLDPRHTMCAFRPGQCSGKRMIRSGGMSCQDRDLILDTHNRLRQKVSMGEVRGQPAAINMQTMVWDDELANVAQRWADQCMPGHDASRNVARFTVGQNVAATWTFERDIGDTPDFATQIEAWFNEVNQHGFPKSSLEPFRFSKATGHYTQMAWAETYLVGCGYAYYEDPSRGFTKIYVCNYGPGGNVVGGTMYNVGYPGQQYCVNDGLRPSPHYHGLCEQESVNYQGPCVQGSFYQPPPSQPVSNSIAGGHNSLGDEGHLLGPHHSLMAHHPLGDPEYPDHDDLMRPSDLLMKGIRNPFMGLMKILNPLNILNRFTG